MVYHLIIILIPEIYIQTYTSSATTDTVKCNIISKCRLPETVKYTQVQFHCHSSHSYIKLQFTHQSSQLTISTTFTVLDLTHPQTNDQANLEEGQFQSSLGVSFRARITGYGSCDVSLQESEGQEFHMGGWELVFLGPQVIWVPRDAPV